MPPGRYGVDRSVMSEETARVVLSDIADRTGVARPSLHIYDSGPVNAYCTWAGSHEICIHAGLLGLPDKEIRAVLAHELGHAAQWHPLLLGIDRLVAVATTVVSWVFLPIGPAIFCTGFAWLCHVVLTRITEYQADAFACGHCGTRDGALSWLQRHRGLQPWYSMHPTPQQRIARILLMEQRQP